MVAANQRGIEPLNRNGSFDGNQKKPNPPYRGKSPARVRKIVQRSRTDRSGFRLTWVWALVALLAAGIEPAAL